MDSFNLFKKLCAGAKFDFKKFHDDAEKLRLIRKCPSEPSKQANKTSGISQEYNAKDEISKNASSATKRKRKLSGFVEDDNSDNTMDGNVDSAEQLSNYDSNDIEIGGNMLLMYSKRKRLHKKKKDKNLTSTKLLAQKQEQVNHLRKEHHIKTWGSDIPDPITKFEDLADRYNMSPVILANIKKLEYKTPTPIQMQAIPLIIDRRELLACAPTGSGKTAAFVVPILHYLQKPSKHGFRVVVVSPTRELANQIYRDFLYLAEGTGMKVYLLSKSFSEASKKTKADVLVTTPNRLVYLLQRDPPGISLKNVEWLIIDESDKLFETGELGFRDQLAVIYKACDSVNIRRGMFSATFSFELEEWCKLNLDNVVMVSIGVRNSAAESVKQELIFVGDEAGKLLEFRNIIRKGVMPPILIFVETKERAKELFSELIYEGINVDVIHSDRPQEERDNVVKSFRAGNIWVLICTELMGRGIDFKGVNLVINFDFPRSTISYIHRIGRTGRAGHTGHAITFFTESDRINLRSIAQVMKNSGCDVPDYMFKLRKPSKKLKRQLLKKAPKRERISTVPLYDLEKQAKKEKIILRSKLKNKVKKKKLKDGEGLKKARKKGKLQQI